jgi:hypothetical protein
MAEATATKEAPTPNAADIVTMNRDDLKNLLNSSADQAVAKYVAQMNAGNGPAKVMQAKVSDGFIKPGRRDTGEVLKNYRIDGPAYHAVKIAEIDMEIMRKYEADRSLLPLDREGFPYSPRNMAARKGKFITIIGGRVSARSQNQIEQLEWLKTQPTEEGGLPGLYEVTNVDTTWQCYTCKPALTFGNKQDWESHREATHGIAREQAA